MTENTTFSSEKSPETNSPKTSKTPPAREAPATPSLENDESEVHGMPGLKTFLVAIVSVLLGAGIVYSSLRTESDTTIWIVRAGDHRYYSLGKPHGEYLEADFLDAYTHQPIHVNGVDSFEMLGPSSGSNLWSHTESSSTDNQ